MKAQELVLGVARQMSKQRRLTDWLDAHTSWDSPFSDERSRYPYALFEREREKGAIYKHKLYRTWIVLGYDECQSVLASPDFSSGTTMSEMLEMHPYRRLSPGARDFVGNILIFVDGEIHARLRRLVSRAFTPRKVSALEPRILEITERLLEDLASTDRVDLHATYNSTLPVHVMGELLGIPRDRWSWLQQISTELTKLFDPIRGFEPSEMETAIRELRGYVMALIDIRRESPTDDLLSTMVAVEDHGDQLSTNELIGLVGSLIIAGSETTTGLMGTAIVNLVRYPDQRALLVNRPDLWPNAIEELLRYDPPVTSVPRTSMRETVVHGVDIPAGQLVEVMISAANRDPRRYVQPGELRVDRDDPTPLSFGHGVHYCIGAALARSTARIGLHAFLDRFPHYRVDLDAVTWRTSATLRGPTGLPVALT